MRVLIVDDEPLARRRLRALCAGERDVEIVGEHGAGAAAVAAIEREEPDLVFLDVQMPELDGFEVLERVARRPAVVFVTAHDEHALRAFEVHAVDYLLKPFRKERFAETLRRVRERLASGGGGRMAALIDELARRRAPGRVALRDGATLTVVREDRIDWIEADGNYVKVHAGAEAHLIRETLASLEARLDPARFARIHRGALLNLDRLAGLVPSGKNDALAVLSDGTRLPVSRTYRARLESLVSRLP